MNNQDPSENNPILAIIEQQNVIDQKAYITFNQEYDLKHPAPKEGRSWHSIAINVGAFSALIVSGAFTIPVFAMIMASMGMHPVVGFVVGVFGFFMVNGSLFAGTNKLVDGVYRPQAVAGKLTQQTVLKFLFALIVFDVALDVLSNLYFIMFGFGILTLGSNGNSVFSILLGVFMALAPSMVSIAGGAILALNPLESIIQKQSYEIAKNRAWGRYKGKRGLDLDVNQLADKYVAKQLGMLDSPANNLFMNIHERREPAKKRTKVRQSVHSHLDINPSDVNLKRLELANKLNLSVGLVTEEARNWQNEKSMA